MGGSRVQLMVMGALSAVLFGVFVACSRQEAPKLEPAAAPPPAPPPAPVVRDAGSDVGDAATDAGDAGPVHHAKKAASPPASGGGGGGALKIEGSLPRAEGDKIVRGAQPKLRDCFEQANPPGSGAKGRVSFKMTVDDRGHVTLTEISKSTLPGGSDVETCMVHVLRDLRFPRATGETTLSFQASFGR